MAILADLMVASMVFVLASRSLIITVAQVPSLELGHGCSPETYKRVNETAFQDNINSAFASLASNISSSTDSFFATTVSNKSDTDAVYALLLCRKYLTSKECLECLTTAGQSLKNFCSDNGYNGGRIYLDDCLLRYENNTFFEQGTDGGNSSSCVSSYATNPLQFNQTAKMLLSELITNASRRDRYAVGKASNASTTVYGLAQCAPTLSKDTCKECLEGAQRDVVTNCLPKEQGRGLQGTCFLRYATDPFYDNSTSSSRNTTPDSSTSLSNRNFKTWPILLGSIGTAALMGTLR